MTDNKTLLTYGSLLHDIGKIVNRAKYHNVKHTILGAAFIADILGDANNAFSEQDSKAILDQINFHHYKELEKEKDLANDSLAWITYYADNISAGMDRKNEGDSEWRPIFVWYRHLRKIYNTLLKHEDDNKIEHKEYQIISDYLKDSIAKISVSLQGANQLLDLLESSIYSIPASTNVTEITDVSLFDHVKTTSAIAACVYDYLVGQGVDNFKKALFRKTQSYQTNMFLLYSWDMSGIQSFIYDISGDGALKQLRARSLYLELIMEHVADELLSRLQLSRANLLYLGGGHSYLLLPNTSSVKETLEDFEVKLHGWFIDTYRTDLYLASSYVECSAYDLRNVGDDKQRYRNLYRDLANKLSNNKASRYTAKQIAKLDLNTYHVNDHERECTECHRSYLLSDDNDKCYLCAALEKISKSLVAKDIYVITEMMNNDIPYEIDDELLGKKASLLLPFNKRLTMYSDKEFKYKNPEAYRIYTKNKWGWGTDNRYATHLWVGDFSADTLGDINNYASQSATLKRGQGVKRLGVLRADVDNLGAIFADGFEPEEVSISKTTTLSRSLSYFFKKEIRDLLERSSSNRNQIGRYQVQIIYSGGDDLFIIGNWSDIINAAIDIRNALNNYTGNNSISISAGIGIYNPKYPIARMALEVGDLVDAAKAYSAVGSYTPTKNAIALWSDQNVFSWDEFVDKVKPRYDEIADDFHDNSKGGAFLHRLLEMLRYADDVISLPRLAFFLARSFEDDKEHGSDKSKKYYDWVTDDQERKYLIVALEWYLLSIREGDR